MSLVPHNLNFISQDELDEFCHPQDGHDYERPFLYGESDVAACNGWLAILVSSYVDCSRKSPNAAERLEKLPWHEFEEVEKRLGGDKWLSIAETGGKMRKRKESLWIPTDGAKWRISNFEKVILGHHLNVIPLPCFQLMCALPKCEVYVGPVNGVLLYRFNGGRGLISLCKLDDCDHYPKFHWLKPREEILAPPNQRR